MPDTATSPAAGLLSVRGREPIPLRSVGVRAELSIIGARVTITQHYFNGEQAPIEAVYVFPLDEGAAVCGFEAVVDGVRFAGQVLERDKAFERYDDAIMRGDGGYLLDEERPDVFVASIGNLPPGREVAVEISYVSELRVAGDEMRFVLPTTVAPRYAPASDRVGVGRPDSETLNPPLAADVPYGLSLHVDVSLPQGVRRIESPSHPVSMSFDGTRTTVTLAQERAALDRDFVLTLQAPLDEPNVRIERDDEGRASLAVSIVPRFETRRVASEVVLLVDRSGSMDGSSIEQVRNALQLCLRALEPGCRFNIYSFGSSHSCLFPESRLYDDESLSLASGEVRRMDARMGGTEILPALQAVLDSPRQDALPRQVIVLTDGEVTNTDDVIGLAARHAAGTRIFTVGIGSSASHHLVRGLARAGRGSAEFIYPGERIEPKVVRLFDRLLSPSVTDVRVDWGGMRVTQVPHELTSIFSGERLVLYGFEADLCAATVRIAGRRGDQELAFVATIDPASAAMGRTVATLAARARIRELEEHPDRARGSRQRRGATTATREIVALSTRYRVMSRETSFVAVEQRDTPVEGEVQLRRVPIRLADGWGGIDSRPRLISAGPGLITASLSVNPSLLDSLLADALSAMALQRAPSDTGRAAPQYSGDPDPIYGSGSTFGPPARKGIDGAVRPDVTRRRYMHDVLGLQRANGAWELTGALAHHVGIHIQQLEDAVPSSTLPEDEARGAWATAIAIAWCRRYAPHLEPEWGAAVRKGQAHLASVIKGDANAWIDAALALYAVVHVRWNDGLKQLQEILQRDQ